MLKNSNPNEEIRYWVEHEYIPKKLLRGRKGRRREFLNNLIKDPYRVFLQQYEKLGIAFLYQKEDFHCMTKTGEDYNITMLILPAPESTPLCYRVYIVWDDELKSMKYFTIESGATRENVFLCSWDKRKNHYNYGPIKNLNTVSIEKAEELLKEEIKRIEDIVGKDNNWVVAHRGGV